MRTKSARQRYLDFTFPSSEASKTVRACLPKGTSFKQLTQHHLDTIVQAINQRPRKCLAYRNQSQPVHNQSRTLVIIRRNAVLVQYLPKHLVLRLKILNDALLLTVEIERQGQDD